MGAYQFYIQLKFLFYLLNHILWLLKFTTILNFFIQSNLLIYHFILTKFQIPKQFLKSIENNLISLPYYYYYYYEFPNPVIIISTLFLLYQFICFKIDPEFIYYFPINFYRCFMIIQNINIISPYLLVYF